MRENVLNVLDNLYDAKDLIAINDLLNLKTPQELKGLENTLNELIDEYLVFKTKKDKYILLKNCPYLKIGKYSSNKKNFGFVILDKEDDIYVRDEFSKGAIDGDIVLCEITGKGIKREGHINRIIKRDLHDLVGEIVLVNNKLSVRLSNEKLDLTLKMDDSINRCVEGQIVLISLDKKIGPKSYKASIKKVIGHKNDPGVDILSIAYMYDIEPNFSKEVEEELKSIPTEVNESDLVGRVDLTDEIIFTIDGKDTKDIDDAISLKKENDEYVLGVHIADVSNYVKENTALGDAAYERGTSNYLADTVIPMIPHQLSNGICSLNEGVLRLTMSCVMHINSHGKVTSYDIFKSYIKSSKKMNYTDVNNILMRDIVKEDYKPYKDILIMMNKLAHIIRQERISRGYLDFDLDEPKIVQDENGVAIDVIRDEREDGEKLIEDFMIIANETVATHIYNMDLPFIYRVHSDPSPEKISDFVNLLKILGYRLNTRINEITPIKMQHILTEISDKKEFKVLSSLLLRSMKKAEYSKENIGHFGLGSKAYTHFTSPIRRFPDLTVHRLLKKYLYEKDYSMTTISTLNSMLEQIAKHSSDKEVAAVNAERAVDDMKMAEYMESHIGEEYDGMITSVTNFGFYVELDNMIEGLVHIKTIKGDYYNYVPDRLALIGKSTKKTYTIGDIVHVKCTNASKKTMLIDFEICEAKNGNKK